jgi:glycosyltransferase involved in cell wall biosynthesis
MVLEAINKIDKIGIVGVCVENKDYPIIEINGVPVMTKSGNINGGCMAIPRQTFKKLGYFQTNYLAYGRDDTDIDFRAKRLGLKNVYIAKKGIHLDKNEFAKYSELKKQTHQVGSIQDLIFDKNVKKYEIDKNYYIPYVIPKTNQAEFDILRGNMSDVENEKKIAVITITFNSERIIYDTIKSVSNQSISKKDFVHIIVDIGSSDKTKDICRKIEKENSHIKFISLNDCTHVKAYNHIVYDYLPSNFPYVKYVAFVEQGDLIIASALKEIIAAFENNENKEVGAFYSGFSIIDEKNRIVDNEFKKAIMVKNQLSEDGQEKLRNFFIVDNPCRYIKAFRLEFVYDVGGFQQKYPYNSDYHMIGKMLGKHKVAKIDKILYMLKKVSSFKPNYDKATELKKVKKEFFNIWDQRKRKR